MSVVIATRCRPGLLARCLKGVGHQRLSPSRVFVVDNTVGDEATREVAEAAGATYLVEPRRGVSHARNTGARAATTDVVAYLDDDAVPDSNWLSALLTEFRDPRVAAVTGRILELAEGEGPVHAATVERAVVFGGPTRLSFDQTSVDWFERACFGGVGQGANLAIRRSVFGSWAGFDERLGAGTRIVGAEEHHAFFCLIDRGHRVVYTPEASIYHPYPATAADVRTLRLRQLQSASAHLALLFAEEKRYRWRAAKYGLGVLARRPRAWRTEATAPQLGAWQTARGRVMGVAAYVRMRFRPRRTVIPSPRLGDPDVQAMERRF